MNTLAILFGDADKHAYMTLFSGSNSRNQCVCDYMLCKNMPKSTSSKEPSWISSRRLSPIYTTTIKERVNTSFFTLLPDFLFKCHLPDIQSVIQRLLSTMSFVALTLSIQFNPSESISRKWLNLDIVDTDPVMLPVRTAKHNGERIRRGDSLKERSSS